MFWATVGPCEEKCSSLDDSTRLKPDAAESALWREEGGGASWIENEEVGG